MTGASKNRTNNKIAKGKLYDVKMDLEYWITDLEWLRGYLQKLGVMIDDLEEMIHILSKLHVKTITPLKTLKTNYMTILIY